MIEQAIYEALTTCEPITAITTTARIFPVVLQKGTTEPSITFRISATTESPTLDTSGLERIRVQIDSWADDYFDAANLRATLVAAFNGYQDANFTSFLMNKADLYAENLLMYQCVAEFTVESPSLS